MLNTLFEPNELRISQPLLKKREGKELYHEQKLTDKKAKVFRMYSDKEYTVRIRFWNELVDVAIDEFRKDVMMVPIDEEHFKITVPVEVSPPFYVWSSTFGRRVKISLQELVVKKMQTFLQKVMDMYEEER